MKSTIALAVFLTGTAIGGTVLAEPPVEQPAVTVEAVLPGCRSLIATQGVPTSSEAGFCSGLIDGLLYLGTMIPADFCFIAPSGVPRHQVILAIVEEIEAVYPSARQQHFRALAIDVLEYKWPCHLPPRVLTRE